MSHCEISFLALATRQVDGQICLTVGLAEIEKLPLNEHLRTLSVFVRTRDSCTNLCIVVLGIEQWTSGGNS